MACIYQLSNLVGVFCMLATLQQLRTYKVYPIADANKQLESVLVHVGPEVEKTLTYSRSFTGTNVSMEHSKINKIEERFPKDCLKSTSLVMQIQNPISSCNFHKLGEQGTVEFNHFTSSKLPSLQDRSEKVLKLKDNYNEITKHYNENSLNMSNCLNKDFSVVKLKSSNFKQSVEARNKFIQFNVPYINNMKINPLFIEDEKDSLDVTVSHSFPLIDPPKDTEESSNGIPEVLDVLDDLSRCIDEVIIESPKKISTKHNTKAKTQHESSVFKIIEDCNENIIPQFKHCNKKDSFSVNYSHENIKCQRYDKEKVIRPSQLDLLKEILDPGEISEDSLKADEEVRTYMSTGDDDDDDDTLSSELSGSWSRMRTFRHISRETSKRQAKEGTLGGKPLNIFRN